MEHMGQARLAQDGQTGWSGRLSLGSPVLGAGLCPVSQPYLRGHLPQGLGAPLSSLGEGHSSQMVLAASG